ncbi:hypothetical protein B0H66DRAFT_620668 [Apodospora peruviana]|uniref:DUF7708 domain-containing protein n=1 Tax=Apodospora peruviana TaxID=516989 RepID=A0AAE0M7Y6_9PEZI|nr:hypothetical protein B0H66DRAFT_620668 [Apodospora peruviana]
MDGDDIGPALHGVVRRYSLIVAEERPGDTLSQALGATARHEIAEEKRRREDSWLAWLQSQECHNNPTLVHLERHKRKLVERWESFNSNHPGLQGEGVFQEGRGPPRLDSLLHAAQDAEAAWEKKKESGIGKAKSAIENFMETMNNHSYLFSIIPSGDKYTSLITGVMTSITKAFVNHKKIAGLFSEALERITQDLATVRESVRMSDTPQVKAHVVELYVAVFNFLCDAMDWYGGSRKKRLLVSFRQNYADDIRKNTGEVKEAIHRIRLQADQATQSRARETHQDTKGILHAVKSLHEKMENLEEGLELAAEKDRENPAASTAALEKLTGEFMLILGRSAMRTLVATGEAQQGGRKSPLYRHIDSADDLEEASEDITDDMSDMASYYTRADIQEATAPFLKQYFEDGRSEVLLALGGGTEAHKVDRTFVFVVLWIEGPAAFTPAERQLSVVAMLLCNSALDGEAPIPCVSFTSKSTYFMQDPSDFMSRQEKVLIAMLYSIAGQLTQLLPEELELELVATHTFEPQRFAALDGSFASASAALDLIESLLAYGPPTLMLILNRLQVAECPIATPHLERLVKLLKAYDSENIIKVLFITQGSSSALTATLDFLTEKVNAWRMVQAKAGQPLRGWSSLGNLKARNL